jgi:hypothetical protein
MEAVSPSPGGASAFGRLRLECWNIEGEGRLTLAWSVPCPADILSFQGLTFRPNSQMIASIEGHSLLSE